VALLWKNQAWFPVLKLTSTAPWPIPMRKDLLSGQGLDLASSPGAVVPKCMGHQRVPANLPEGVLSTILDDSIPQNGLCFLAGAKVKAFQPKTVGLREVLSFLQELLDKGRTPPQFMCRQ